MFLGLDSRLVAFTKSKNYFLSSNICYLNFKSLLDFCHHFQPIYNGNRTEWSLIPSVVILHMINKLRQKRRDQLVNLMIINMIRERIGREEVLLPININCYNFRKQQIHLGQISLVETMSKVKNMSPFWKFLIFFG